MFESLSDKLQGVFSNLRGKGKLNEKDVDAAMREIRMALLEADVNYKVVKKFIANVKERAIGEEVMESLTPGQMVIKIVNEELTSLMGEKEAKLNISSNPPTVIMLCGLQGAGKTTHAGKLAYHLKAKNKKPLLVACDVYRPAAIKQLEVVGEQANTPVFSMGDKISPVEIAKAGLKEAKSKSYDVVIIDTAGRLHIDVDLMTELQEIKEAVNPDDILLVVDAMTGQDAVNVADTFNEKLELSGVILTKLDGDTRGGAALSIREVTSKPIKFIGTGEKLDELQPFHPDRMASRILGMGDVLSLIEKAEDAIDAKKANELADKLRSQSFTFNDYLDQLNQIRNMGPLDDLLAMIPGVNSKMLKGMNVDEKEIAKVEAIILSMTEEERIKPDIIDRSRRERIASGSGMQAQDVNRLLKQFKETKKIMKRFTSLGKKKSGFNLPFFK